MNYVKGIILIVLGVVLGIFWVFGFTTPHGVVSDPSQIQWGVTFSKKWIASFPGIDDWRVPFTAMFEDLGVNRVRLPVYWDEIETEPGVYNFDDLDWQVAMVGRYEGSMILTVGMRVPRWPECHTPDWIDAMSRQEKHERLLSFIEVIVGRYRDSTALRYWQVENEPFLLKFGECPRTIPEHLDEEIALVRDLDPDHPIIVSDSGELSLWVSAASRADVFGTTMYKVIWNPLFGQFWYPLVPQFFHAKANLVQLFVEPNPEKIIVIELQAEPWQHKQTYEVGVEQHYDSMSMPQFVENVTFAERVGFPEVYAWGVEWWYWMKEVAGDDRYWNYMKPRFDR